MSRPILLLLAVAGALLGLAAAWVAFGWDDPRHWVPDLAVGWSFIACGLVGSWRRPNSGDRAAHGGRRLYLVPGKLRIGRCATDCLAGHPRLVPPPRAAHPLRAFVPHRSADLGSGPSVGGDRVRRRRCHADRSQ